MSCDRNTSVAGCACDVYSPFRGGTDALHAIKALRTVSRWPSVTAVEVGTKRMLQVTQEQAVDEPQLSYHDVNIVNTAG